MQMLSRAYAKILAFFFFFNEVTLMRTFEHEFKTLQHLVLDLQNIRWERKFKNIQ